MANGAVMPCSERALTTALLVPRSAKDLVSSDKVDSLTRLGDEALSVGRLVLTNRVKRGNGLRGLTGNRTLTVDLTLAGVFPRPGRVGSGPEGMRHSPGRIRTCVSPVMSRVLSPLSYRAAEVREKL
jgi:hypothetical protein